MEPSKCATVVVFIAICIFGMSAWMALNGLWVEIPLLVQVLPERWKLPSYIVIILQVAKVSPISYMIIKRIRPNIVKDWLVSCIIICIGIIACFILIFTWDKTSYIGGELHSSAFLTLSFFLTTVDCTSSVVYLPYMAKFKSPVFMTALYVGEGLSGLVAAVVGLIQGSGSSSKDSYENIGNITSNNTLNETMLTMPTLTNSEPFARFSVSVYFIILTLILISSLVSFLFINFHSFFDPFKVKDELKTCSEGTVSDDCDNHTGITFDAAELEVGKTYLTQELENQENTGQIEPLDVKSDEETSIKSGHNENMDQSRSSLDGKNIYEQDNKIFDKEENSSVTFSSSKVDSIINDDKPIGLPRKYIYRCVVLYILVIVINSLAYGVIPAIQSYACLSYGSLTYDYAVKLAVLANPLACLLTLLITVRRLSILTILTIFGSLMTAYQIYLAALSPNPILKDEVSGKALAIVSSILLTSCFSYVKVCISMIFLELGGEKLLLYNGAFSEIGALIGAITSFLLVNTFKVFRQA